MERKPKPGEFYRHFKGKLYQILAVAKHSETMELMVVYQALYGSYEVYVRPYEMFLSRVDRAKYPDVTQRFRFEQVQPEQLQEAKQVLQSEREKNVQEQGVSDPVNEVCEELLLFLDARTYVEKQKILDQIKSKIDERTLIGIEISLDLGDTSNRSIEERLAFIQNTLSIRARYETIRLR